MRIITLWQSLSYSRLSCVYAPIPDSTRLISQYFISFWAPFWYVVSLLPFKFLFWLFSFQVFFGCSSWRTPLKNFLGLTLLHSRVGAYFSACFAFSKRRWLKALVLGITEEEQIREKSQELAFDNNTISLESFYLIGYMHQLINVSFLLEIMPTSFKSSISVL